MAATHAYRPISGIGAPSEVRRKMKAICASLNFFMPKTLD
jgi:hypothetical protein